MQLLVVAVVVRNYPAFSKPAREPQLSNINCFLLTNRLLSQLFVLIFLLGGRGGTSMQYTKPISAKFFPHIWIHKHLQLSFRRSRNLSQWFSSELDLMTNMITSEIFEKLIKSIKPWHQRRNHDNKFMLHAAC